MTRSTSTRPVTRHRPPALDIAVAGALAVAGLLLGIAAWMEGWGSLQDPGSGFFPLLVAAALVVSSVAVLAPRRTVTETGGSHRLADLARQADAADAAEESDGLPGNIRVGGVVAVALLVPLLAETVGFVTTLSVTIMAMSKVAGLRGWWRPVALGVAFGSLVWVVFVMWLHVPLPIGTFGLG